MRDGGAGRNRTDDLYNAIVALSQLSYGPMCAWIVRHEGKVSARAGRTLCSSPYPFKGKIFCPRANAE
jgi:hypothetical protein